MVGRILEETGLAEQVLSVHITPAVRSIVREQGKSIARAEDFFREETQEQLQNGVLTQLMDSLATKGWWSSKFLFEILIFQESDPAN